MRVYTVKTFTAILICALLLSFMMPAAKAAAGTGTITGSAVNLRKSPGGLVIGLVRRGDIVTVEGTEGSYIKIVTASGVQGFVYKQYITVTGDTTGVSAGQSVEAVLKKGSRGSDVVNLQTRLKELGFYTYSKITGYFGSITHDALVRFQASVSLTANGVADSATLTALYSSDAQQSVPQTETPVSFNVNQTLQVGSRGADVSALQTCLKEKGYYTYNKITGYFGSITRDAVMRFQQAAGLAQSGVAGPDTLSQLFGIAADPSVTPAYQYIAMRTDITLKKGRTGDDVRDMQTALTQKGYYSGPINGSFDSTTLYAVMAFQRAMSLTVDGLAGNYTLSALYSLLSPPAEAPTPGRLDKGESIPIEMPKWCDIDECMPRDTNIIIVDIQTGFTFEACRTGGTLHADVEPLYAIDTATIYAIYGDKWSWERRPIWVLVNGHRLAASMNGMPHGYDTLPDNDMRGQFCVHFVGSRTHGTRKVDSDHQACIQQAYEAGLVCDTGT